MESILQALPAFLLVFCRITSFFVVAPIFSSRVFPTTLKLGIGFFVSLMVFLALGFETDIPMNGDYILLVMREVFAGLLIGYTAYLFFTIVQTAGGLMDLQMGFAIANIVDPMTGVSAPMLGNFKYMLMTVIFLALNGHHYLLAAIMDSYAWLPLDNALYATYREGGIADFLARTFAQTFLLAFQIAAPIVVAMFIADVGLALLARTAPQYNVFVIGIPLKILIGLALLVVLLPGFSALFQLLFNRTFQALEQLFLIMRSAS